ncbi:MAG: hypothetical protein WAV05_15490 [Anaerolineales bacterium]
MINIYPTNLSATLDATAETFFYQKSIPAQQREDTASLIISRQNRSGANSGFFIPFAAETETQPRLFTGEPLHTDFAYRHIQLIECARILILLGLDTPPICNSISCAEQRMAASCYSKFCSKGECKVLTLAYMRYVNISALQDSEPHLAYFLSRLADFRDGKGKWSNFPYYYTLLILSELDDPLANEELKYAAPTCEKLLNHIEPSDHFSKRRHLILTNILSRN